MGPTEKLQEAREEGEGQAMAGWLTSTLAASSALVMLAVGKKKQVSQGPAARGAYCVLQLPTQGQSRPESTGLRPPPSLTPARGPGARWLREAGVCASLLSELRRFPSGEAVSLWV